MSLKSLLSEINTGIWMMETPTVSGYQEIISGLRSGRFQNEEAQMFSKLMGEPYVDQSSGKPELN